MECLHLLILFCHHCHNLQNRWHFVDKSGQERWQHVGWSSLWFLCEAEKKHMQNGFVQIRLPFWSCQVQEAIVQGISTMHHHHLFEHQCCCEPHNRTALDCECGFWLHHQSWHGDCWDHSQNVNENWTHVFFHAWNRLGLLLCGLLIVLCICLIVGCSCFMKQNRVVKKTMLLFHEKEQGCWKKIVVSLHS